MTDIASSYNLLLRVVQIELGHIPKALDELYVSRYFRIESSSCRNVPTIVASS